MTELPVSTGLAPAVQRNFDALAAAILTGRGDPTGVVPARVGTLYVDLDGGAATTLYVKETGDITSTGWAAK